MGDYDRPTNTVLSDTPPAEPLNTEQQPQPAEGGESSAPQAAEVPVEEKKPEGESRIASN